jgi:hypothetical protein
VGSYAAKFYYPAKQAPQEAVQAVSVARIAQTKAETQEAEVTAATPEDPGAVRTDGPLAVWTREAERAQPGQPVALPTAEQYLRVEFPLGKSAQFTFVIPPHTVSPRLHGSFSSSIRHSRADTSQDAAKVDLVLMNAEQFDDFVHGRPADATFEVESSNQTVDFMLPGAHDQPQEYHLIFRDPVARTKLLVKADFSVNAE